MKTPDEIKKGLECCSNRPSISCKSCSYQPLLRCVAELTTDALALIQQLERERDEALKDADKSYHAAKEATDSYYAMLRERDAAVEYLSGDCDYCKHRAEKWLPDFKMNDFCLECCTHDYCNWQWRGVQKEVK